MFVAFAGYATLAAPSLAIVILSIPFFSLALILVITTYSILFAYDEHKAYLLMKRAAVIFGLFVTSKLYVFFEPFIGRLQEVGEVGALLLLVASLCFVGVAAYYLSISCCTSTIDDKA